MMSPHRKAYVRSISELTTCIFGFAYSQRAALDCLLKEIYSLHLEELEVFPSATQLVVFLGGGGVFFCNAHFVLFMRRPAELLKTVHKSLHNSTLKKEIYHSCIRPLRINSTNPQTITVKRVHE